MTNAAPVVFRATDLRVSLYDADDVPRKRPRPHGAQDDVLSPPWRSAIRGVSFEVRRGEVLSIVGESASGKTLSMYAALRLLGPGAQATGGEVELFGQSFPVRVDNNPIGSPGRHRRGRVVDPDDEWRRLLGSRVGILFQDPIGAWTPQLTIGEQAGEALDEHFSLTTEEIERRVRDALGSVNLPKRGFGAFSFLLSRGQAQRAMLAAAIVKAPDLLIADEPLTGLDPTSAASILALLRDMQEARGMAMIFITHDLARAASFSDRIAVMYAGRIVETGPVEDVIRRPRHPYTEGLIGALPMVGQDRLRPIRGAPPGLLESFAGCSFASRCDFVSIRCADVPPLVHSAGDSADACWRSSELSLQGLSSER